MNFIFFSITEHPWGREMLSQLIDSGFVPSLIIEENSEGGNTEREKFEFRLGSTPLAPTMKSQIEKHNIPFVQVPIHNDEHFNMLYEEVVSVKYGKHFFNSVATVLP